MHLVGLVLGPGSVLGRSGGGVGPRSKVLGPKCDSMQSDARKFTRRLLWGHIDRAPGTSPTWAWLLASRPPSICHFSASSIPVHSFGGTGRATRNKTKTQSLLHKMVHPLRFRFASLNGAPVEFQSCFIKWSAFCFAKLLHKMAHPLRFRFAASSGSSCVFQFCFIKWSIICFFFSRHKIVYPLRCRCSFAS